MDIYDTDHAKSFEKFLLEQNNKKCYAENNVLHIKCIKILI